MLEYVLVLLALLGLVSVMTVVIAATRHSVEVTESLIRSDYP